VFADFSFAHRMKFSGRLATGEVVLSPAMAHERGCCLHACCKANVLHHLLERMNIKASQILAVGDGENDICLLESAGTSVAFRPKAPRVQAAARYTVTGALSDVLLVPGVVAPSCDRCPFPAALVGGAGHPLDVGVWG
jgi:phosphoserine phosphatase